MLADVLWNAGDFLDAVEHGQAGIALDAAHPAGTDAGQVVDDAGIMCRIWVAWALCPLGYIDQARAIADEALALGMSHPSALVRTEAQTYVVGFHRHMWDFKMCREHCEELVSLSAEFVLPVFQALADVELGWLRACDGDAEGVSQLKAGVERWRASGSSVAAPEFLGVLADGCLRTGRTAEGLDAVVEAIEISEETGAMMNRSELYRIRGELFQRSDDGQDQRADEAEGCFQRAIEIAREQQAKTGELRATVSLCRLWATQGKTADARLLLDDVYGWFTEGFDTPDLRAARALREDLA